MSHPKDRRPPIDRREFMRRAAAAGIALPSLAAILAACGSDSSSTATGSAPRPPVCSWPAPTTP